MLNNEKPIEFVSMSLKDWQIQRLLDAGYEKQSDGTYVNITDSMRHQVEIREEGMVSTIDILCGVAVIDPHEDM